VYSAGYYIGWTNDGEWLEYEVDLQAGEYEIIARVATAVGNSTFKILVGNLTASNARTINTTGWDVWEDLNTGSFHTSAGMQTVRLEFTSA